MGKIICKNKPLPEHTKLKYVECYAKVLLEHYFSNLFSNLIIQDKPDLYDSSKKVGIEVTECKDKNLKEAEKLWYTMPHVSEKQKERNIDRMKQFGIEYQGGIQVWPDINLNKGIDSPVFDSLYESIRKKLNKLNQRGLYSECNEYHLFVYSELWVDKSWRKNLANKLNEISTLFDKRYSIVFISTQNELLSLDMKTFDVVAFDIEKEQSILAHKAREMVEEGEKR